MPEVLKIIVENYGAHEVAGHIKIFYPKIESDAADVEEIYDEDEQLYAAAKHTSLKEKYKSQNIPILHNFGSFYSIIVPNFSSIIVNNILGAKLKERLDDKIQKTWITISVSDFLSDSNVLRMQNIIAPKMPDVFTSIQLLEPPNFITGIAASLTSYVSSCSKNAIVGIVLKGEGHMGFEKIEPDSILDAAYRLSELLPEEQKESYLAKICLSVRKLNGYTSSGMYI